MLCPFCSHREDRVVDSRESREGHVIRRRRECRGCGKRYTTYERFEDVPLMVVKKDGRRERFDRSKIQGGLLRACEKRPVSARQIERLIDQVERMVSDPGEREFTTDEIGEHLMNQLQLLDKVAYVRFASVYRDFQDVRDFVSEVSNLSSQ